MAATVITVSAVATATWMRSSPLLSLMLSVITAMWKRSSPLWVVGGEGKEGRHRLGGGGGSHRQVSYAKVKRLSPPANYLTASRLSPHF